MVRKQTQEDEAEGAAGADRCDRSQPECLRSREAPVCGNGERKEIIGAEFLLLYFIYFCVCATVHTLEFRRQPVGVVSLLPCEPQGFNSCCQALAAFTF